MKRLMLLAAVVLAACNTSPTATSLDSPLPAAQPHISPRATSSSTPDIPGNGGGAASNTALARGVVYDATGNAVGDGYSVQVHSLETRAPYDRTVDVVKGRYATIAVPTRVSLSFTLLYNGEAVLGRNVAAASASGKDIVVNFGGPQDADDPSGAKYAAPVPTTTPTPRPS